MSSADPERLPATTPSQAGAAASDAASTPIPSIATAVAPAAPEPLYTDGRQSQAALDICRGALRALRALGFAGTTELTLATGRRADIIATNAAGEIWIVEIKSSIEDFRSDLKWPEYRDYCDRLLFAVSPHFPREVVPEEVGLLIADRFGGEIVRPSPHAPLAAARRKAMLIAIARHACLRMQTALDPESGRLDV